MSWSCVMTLKVLLVLHAPFFVLLRYYKLLLCFRIFRFLTVCQKLYDSSVRYFKQHACFCSNFAKTQMKIHVLTEVTKSGKDACTCCLYQDTKFGSATSEIEILNEHLQLWLFKWKSVIRTYQPPELTQPGGRAASRTREYSAFNFRPPEPVQANRQTDLQRTSPGPPHSPMTHMHIPV